MKISKLFGLFKRKEWWMSFRDLSERMHQRATVLDNNDDCKSNTRILIEENTDMFGVFKR